MKKLLLMIFITSLSNLGCQTKLPEGAPKPKPIPKCDLIATAETGQYLRCRWNGEGEVWRVPVSSLYTQKTKYICTTDQGFADGWTWVQEMDRWAESNCRQK